MTKDGKLFCVAVLLLLALQKSNSYFLDESKNESRHDNGHHSYFTLFNGAEAGDILNSLTLGARGLLSLADQTFRQRITHFVREKIPRRRNGADGPVGHGYFICTNPDASKLSAASVFSHVGKKTPAFFRFALGISYAGIPDMGQRLHNIAFRMYSKEGNWDILSSGGPVFFVRDPIYFASVNHANNPDKRTNLNNSTNTFDFISSMPQTLHNLIFTYFDMSWPKGWRKMNSYPAHTFKFVNSNGKYVYVRFKFTSLHGNEYFTDEEAARIKGIDPQWGAKDLYSAIDRGDYPAWNLEAQLLPPELVDKLNFNPFDVTKRFFEEDFPPIVLGKFVMNKKPTNWFSESEQVAMNPGNLIPGVQLTMDKILLARTYAYADSAMYRLGPNVHLLPINLPRYFNNPTVRDGQCADAWNGGPEPSYYPNSYGETRNFPNKDKIPVILGPEELRRYNTADDDNYSQPNRSYYLFDIPERERWSARLAYDLVTCPDIIINRLLGELKKINFEIYDRTQKALDNARQQRLLIPPPVYD